jgi:hypothetical protein
MTATDFAKTLLGPRWTTRARCVSRGLALPRWGNLRRVRPFSDYYGFDRGTPIDRYYLERFLTEHRADITGDVLEIQMSNYTRRHGSNLRRTDTVDMEPRFNATYTCDLAASEGVVPTAAYDCFVLPNTLSFLRDLDACLRHALRVIKPGGTILATTAVLGPMDQHTKDYWRLSADGWREVGARVWPGSDMTVRAYGNCLSATAAIMGLAVEELTPAELDVEDPKYPVLVGVRCRKPQ